MVCCCHTHSSFYDKKKKELLLEILRIRCCCCRYFGFFTRFHVHYNLLIFAQVLTPKVITFPFQRKESPRGSSGGDFDFDIVVGGGGGGGCLSSKLL